MDQQEINDLLRKAPASLRSTVRFANWLALAVVIRSATLASLGAISVSGAILFGLFIAGNLCYLAVGLYMRKKYCFFLLFAFAGVPLPGLFVHAFHLLALAVQGDLIQKSGESIIGLVSLIQFLFAAFLFRDLLNRETRQYVFASLPGQ